MFAKFACNLQAVCKRTMQMCAKLCIFVHLLRVNGHVFGAKNNKKSVDFAAYCFDYQHFPCFVGMTGFEPATTRPPDNKTIFYSIENQSVTITQFCICKSFASHLRLQAICKSIY